MTTSDTRTITLVDIPLVWRLSESGTVLDSEMSLTRDARGPSSALLSSILFSRGIYTLIARSEQQQVVGQFRYRPDDYSAHLVYLAPTLPENVDNTAWLHMLDAMSREAGKHGAHTLVAEVETRSNLFETMRTARFATYARQVIWRHEAQSAPEPTRPITLTEENNTDQIGIMSLLCNTIPTLLQQVTAPPSDMRGLVYRKSHQIDAYIAYSEGRQGVYLIPYIHPDVIEEADDILQAAIAHLEQTQRVPVYVCVRSYQSWLESSMAALGFEAWAEQAIMVRHIAAGIRHPSFARVRLRGQLETVHKALPPTWSAALQEDEDKL